MSQTFADSAAPAALDELRARMRRRILTDESEAVAALAAAASLTADERAAIGARAADMVRAIRKRDDPGLMELFLAEYGLSTREGVALMCLAEAMLRVPDAETIDDLIQDKVAPHDWGAHLGDSGSILVNASTWGLMLTGRMLSDEGEGVVAALRGLVRRLGEPAIRLAVSRAMQEMGAQFVLGETMEQAVKRGARMRERGYTFSYDMLGEAARTDADALRYHRAYAKAIRVAGEGARCTVRDNPGVSVKLSALHARYEYGQRDVMLPVMVERLSELARAAARAGIGLNIDAEEADRLDLSLDVIEAVLSDPELAGWDGFGVVVQAYGLRAPEVLDWLHALARKLDRRIMVRLVKGAYWDSEIKRAQVLGLEGYPVFTRKRHTDVSYIACARKLLGMTDRIYPQFATHNAHTAAAVLHMAGERRDHFEFQRLHGMGEGLHDLLLSEHGVRSRIYAPVGAHRDLLAYLVRRLLENGANSSFVHQIVDEDIPPEVIAADPIAAAEEDEFAPDPTIPAPPDLYGAERRNSRGVDLTDPLAVRALARARAPFAAPHRWIAGEEGAPRAVTNPADPAEVVGVAHETDAQGVARAVARARAAQPAWEATPVAARAAILRAAADLYEDNMAELIELVAREAGKNWLDGVAEVREAVDFLRYYAAQAPLAEAAGPARGVIACISPWNFPLAIFTGQISAALATGNAVVAKPAEQTPLTAARAAALLAEAGLPEDVLCMVYGDGPGVGAPLTADPGIDGVCFTGSTEVAALINRQLARSAPEAMLIAETGGLNAMIVDSSALPEQAVRDILASAFQSAGQRCSALRILYVQEDVAATVTEMLLGAMDLLRIGDPRALSTDVGPVIDAEARARIEAHIARAEAEGRLLKRLAAPAGGLFVGPAVIRVPGIEALEEEIFGPVLHIATFRAPDLLRVVEAVNARGYGLTMGVHSRIDGRVQRIVDRAHVGNIYVNRNQIGAVVGCQPFGGEGLSGTGPKAGGPNYLPRFRRPVTQPTAVAAGPALDEAAARAALERLAAAPETRAWAADPARLATLRALLRGRAARALAAAAAVDMGPIDLPGPTGESNQLWLAPRGPALCLGPDEEALLTQCVHALAMGCPVVAAAPGAPRILAPLLRAPGRGRAAPPLVALDGALDPEALTRLPIAVAAATPCAPDRFAALRRALAAREGPIAPLVAGLDAPQDFAHERVLSVDTTAAGGNAELLARSA
ncbi:bifunctional proline dehydrogenase/L-glutamate gamma-semialdehyde dehydrogenase PutA [Oceanicella actignis]|uniref:bifunctional proline dehydrogenase/L-glutamate gamma-semialdehyde dehydrogenase PutA n=1 Tax=Oceanicella actignis TaxID=1189325 RepID=UPI0011E8801F|nr:bifunctional proline dehydrogenase/L-glutamate gamma-semialdehyde dehydrogenase PutA [Oceanicella actignis]TYO88921.1 L-proline dehydrogenase /delta-1-pyrroline-5-carboxylate dehydrogenase [Oceanicella actignis]